VAPFIDKDLVCARGAA
jgi:hypothetical protein